MTKTTREIERNRNFNIFWVSILFTLLLFVINILIFFHFYSNQPKIICESYQEITYNLIKDLNGTIKTEIPYPSIKVSNISWIMELENKSDLTSNLIIKGVSYNVKECILEDKLINGN